MKNLWHYSMRRYSVAMAIVTGILWLGSVTASVAATTENAPVATYTNINGSKLSTASLKGHPTMIFLLTTWCGSCAAGLQALNAHADELRSSGLHLVLLRTYKNEGVDGPGIGAFAGKWAPALNTTNVILGDENADMETIYNPYHYPDLYYLINAQGQIKAIDSAPAATMDKILKFAHQQKAALP